MKRQFVPMKGCGDAVRGSIPPEQAYRFRPRRARRGQGSTLHSRFSRLCMIYHVMKTRLILAKCQSVVATRSGPSLSSENAASPTIPALQPHQVRVVPRSELTKRDRPPCDLLAHASRPPRDGHRWRRVYRQPRLRGRHRRPSHVRSLRRCQGGDPRHVQVAALE
jgi:hypothetical protein